MVLSLQLTSSLHNGFVTALKTLIGFLDSSLMLATVKAIAKVLKANAANENQMYVVYKGVSTQLKSFKLLLIFSIVFSTYKTP